MAENKKLTLEFDNGDKEETEIIGVFDCDNKEYIALSPENDSEDVYIFRYKGGKDDEFDLEDIDSKEEFEAAAKAFDELVKE